MSADRIPPHQDAAPQISDVLRWPWAQFGWCLAGTGFSLQGLQNLRAILGFAAPISGDEPSTTEIFVVLMILAAITCSIPAALLRWGIIRRRRPPIYLSWLRKVNFGLLALVVLSQMAALSIPAMHSARLTQQKAVAAGPWRNHFFANGKVQISTPATWEIVTDANSSTNAVYMADRQNSLFLTATFAPKQDLAVRTLAELSQQSATSLAEQLNGHSSGKTVIGEVDGHPAADIVQTGAMKGVNFVWRTQQIEYSDAWVELRMWTTHSQYEHHFENFDRIATSIRREK